MQRGPRRLLKHLRSTIRASSRLAVAALGPGNHIDTTVPNESKIFACPVVLVLRCALSLTREYNGTSYIPVKLILARLYKARRKRRPAAALQKKEPAGTRRSEIRTFPSGPGPATLKGRAPVAP